MAVLSAEVQHVLIGQETAGRLLRPAHDTSTLIVHGKPDAALQARDARIDHKTHRINPFFAHGRVAIVPQATYVDMTKLGNSVFGTILAGVSSIPRDVWAVCTLTWRSRTNFHQKWDGALYHMPPPPCVSSAWSILPMLFLAALTNVSSVWLLGLFGLRTSSNSHSHCVKAPKEHFRLCVHLVTRG